MLSITRVLLVSYAALSFAHDASAQATTIRDGCRSNIASYSLLSVPTAPTDRSASADMNADPCTQGFGNLYGAWIFYQIHDDGAGGSDSTAQTFNDSNGQLVGPTPDGSGRAISLTWADVDTRGLLEASYDIDIACCGRRCGTTTHAVTLRNLGSNPISLSLFAYADIDLNGSFGDDDLSTFSTNDRHIVVDSDACGGCFEFRGVGADHFHVAAFPVVENHILQVGSPLPDNGLSSGTARDYTGAFEWIVTIPAGQTWSTEFSLGHNCMGCDGPALADNYGTGFGGGNTAPTLIALDRPTPGCPVDVEITGPPNAPTILLVGQSALSFQFPNCPETILVNPNVTISSVTDPVGDVRFALPAICDPALCGDEVFAQAWVLDPRSNGCLALVHSPGLRLKVGSR